MDVPTTVTTALADRPVSGRTCLEAGAGAGNATAGLLAAGADRVYAVTNDPSHARVVADRFEGDGRVATVEADLRATPLVDDSIELITAHGLCNLLEPAALEAVAAELTRVAAPGAHLVLDDYAPLPNDAAAIRKLFSLENAAAVLASGRPALTFYPASVLRAVFSARGWTFDRKLTLLDPVPWTPSHIEAHAEVVRSSATGLSDGLREALLAELEGVLDELGEDGESAGEMYSVAMVL